MFIYLFAAMKMKEVVQQKWIIGTTFIEQDERRGKSYQSYNQLPATDPD